MGKEQRYDIYDLFLKYPEPLVPRRWRRGISERLDSKGEVIEPLNFIDYILVLNEQYYKEAISIPMFYGLKEDDQSYVISVLKEVLKS